MRDLCLFDSACAAGSPLYKVILAPILVRRLFQLDAVPRIAETRDEAQDRKGSGGKLSICCRAEGRFRRNVCLAMKNRERGD